MGKNPLFLMGKEAYQITDYVHDEVVAFCGAMNPKGKLEHSEDEMYSMNSSFEFISVKTFCEEYVKSSDKNDSNSDESRVCIIFA